jgi:hypothetical protein
MAGGSGGKRARKFGDSREEMAGGSGGERARREESGDAEMAAREHADGGERETTERRAETNLPWNYADLPWLEIPLPRWLPRERGRR